MSCFVFYSENLKRTPFFVFLLKERKFIRYVLCHKITQNVMNRVLGLLKSQYPEIDINTLNFIVSREILDIFKSTFPQKHVKINKDQVFENFILNYLTPSFFLVEKNKNGK